MLEILNKICDGHGSLDDLDELEDLATTIKDSALCGLGQTAPNPVLSTLKNFREEYVAHVVEKRCPAGVCKNLINYHITDACIGCGKCKRNCPVDAISTSETIVKTLPNGNKLYMHHVNVDKCIKCGVCFSSCPVQCIVKK